MLQTFNYNDPFNFELGGQIPSLQIAYHTFGQLNDQKDNVIWICHALTANSNVADWWKGLVGKGMPIDTEKHFIVCANILGSCYGSSGSSSIHPITNKKYGIDFPDFTIRDMVRAHQLLQIHLGIDAIQLLIGGSMGGYQALEWALMAPNNIKNLFILASSATESAWGIGIHTAQRMAIMADPDWQIGIPNKGDNGLKAARAIGMLTYRNYELFKTQQTDEEVNKTNDFKASSYLTYQAEKLADRFDAITYYKLTQAMDTHNIARGRNKDIKAILQSISINTLLIGISSDILCPPEEQRFMAQYLPNCCYHEIDSKYGHDGFLIEYEIIGNHLISWLEKQ